MGVNPKMRRLPPQLEAYKRTPEFSHETLPSGLRRSHSTKAGVWGRIVVLEGSLRYRILEPRPLELMLTPDRPGVIEPEILHEVEPAGAVRFYVEFLRAPGVSNRDLRVD